MGGNVVADHVVRPPAFQGTVSVGLLVGLLFAPRRINLGHIVNPEDRDGGLSGDQEAEFFLYVQAITTFLTVKTLTAVLFKTFTELTHFPERLAPEQIVKDKLAVLGRWVISLRPRWLTALRRR